MDHGLTNDEIGLVLFEYWPTFNAAARREELEKLDVERIRARWEGVQQRERAHAKTVERHPPTNVPTDGAALLEQVHAFLGRFVAYPSEDARVAHTLWIVHAHLMDAWESTPRIAFLSPEPASGKTRALEITELLVPDAVEAVNVTRGLPVPQGRRRRRNAPPSSSTRSTPSSARRRRRTRKSAACSTPATARAPSPAAASCAATVKTLTGDSRPTAPWRWPGSATSPTPS